MIIKTLQRLNKRNFRHLLGAPRRFARRRGFGIHSPFAFDFVRRVIAQPCSFYCYPQLDAEARQAGVKSSMVRLVFRVALFFRPSSVVYLGECSSAVKKAVEAACPQPEKCSGSQIVVVSGVLSDVDVRSVVQSAQGGATVVFLNLKSDTTASRAVWASITHGMLFRGSETAIYVGMHHLPHQSFNVWI